MHKLLSYPSTPFATQNRHIDVASGQSIENLGFEGVQANYDIKDLVSKGIVPEHDVKFEFGDRDNLTTGPAGNDIWNGLAIEIPRPAAAGEQMSVVSTDPQDGVGGTGIRTVKIHYLDATGAHQHTTVTMDGTNPVNLTPSNVRFVNALHGDSWGTGEDAAGIVTIYRTGDATRIYSQIDIAANHAPDGTYMVPAGHQFFISNISATATGNKAIKIILRATADFDGNLSVGFHFKRGWTMEDAPIPENLSPQLVLPALSVVKATAYSVIGGGRASINFSGWIEPT